MVRRITPLVDAGDLHGTSQTAHFPIHLWQPLSVASNLLHSQQIAQT